MSEGTWLGSHGGLSGEPGTLIQMLEIQPLNLTTVRMSLIFNVHTNYLVTLLIAEADSVGLMWGPGFCISNGLPGPDGAGGLLQASGCLWAGSEWFAWEPRAWSPILSRAACFTSCYPGHPSLPVNPEKRQRKGFPALPLWHSLPRCRAGLCLQDHVTSSFLLSCLRGHSAQEQEPDSGAARSVDARPASLPSALSSESEPCLHLVVQFSFALEGYKQPWIEGRAWVLSLVHICIRLVTRS